MTSIMSRQRAAAGLGLIVLAVAVIVFPLVFGSPVVTNYAIYALIFVTAVSAWNMFSGFSGYISLGQDGQRQPGGRALPAHGVHRPAHHWARTGWRPKNPVGRITSTSTRAA